MSAQVSFLESLPYFRSLSAEEVRRVGERVMEVSFGRGEVLFLEGEECRGLYVVKSGQVRLFKTSPAGREQVLLIVGPGDTFNDVPVFDGSPNPASASALAASTVYIVPTEAMRSLVSGSPVAMAVIGVLAGRLRHLTATVEDLSFRSVVGRLSRLLLELAAAEGGQLPVPKFTQDEMAAMVGSVRDVVNRSLKLLEVEGAIKIDGHRIRVIAPQKLEKMVWA